jgi:hypothetical protein
MAVTKLIAKICSLLARKGKGEEVAHVVGVSEETNTGDNTGSNMVPSEWSFINLSQSETTTFIWVLDVCEVVVEVVECGITTCGLLSWNGTHLDCCCREDGGVAADY